MNTQLINQIKALQGVKEVTMVNDMAVVVFGPRKLVFTTEDGVDIFSGDRYWIVNKITHSITTISANEMMLSADVFRFSTQESAQKWIEEQKKPKPIYTDPEDGTEFFEGGKCFYFMKGICEVRQSRVENVGIKCGNELYSKMYKSRKLCEIALAKFIMDKYK